MLTNSLYLNLIELSNIIKIITENQTVYKYIIHLEKNKNIKINK